MDPVNTVAGHTEEVKNHNVPVARAVPYQTQCFCTAEVDALDSAEQPNSYDLLHRQDSEQIETGHAMMKRETDDGAICHSTPNLDMFAQLCLDLRGGRTDTEKANSAEETKNGANVIDAGSAMAEGIMITGASVTIGGITTDEIRPEVRFGCGNAERGVECHRHLAAGQN